MLRLPPEDFGDYCTFRIGRARAPRGNRPASRRRASTTRSHTTGAWRAATNR